ncbi:MAG: ribonuclease D [Alphaproteobacteria bacterium]
MMITTTEKLKEVCERFSRVPFVTLDTEFIREKTYYPILCLIQIAVRDEAYCIDPLAEGIDLTPLFDLLQNKQVLKVFHAARQDVEIFYHLTGQVPTPLFDTQIGAMVCGFGDSVSYQQLVQVLTGITLDKSMRYTDWSKRPLSEEQIAYALHDVTHLISVYEKIGESLDVSDRRSWLAEEMAILNNPATYEIDNETAWTRVKCHLTKPQQIHVFAKICAWREKTAKEKNRPRRHIMKDETVQELAVAHPVTRAQMDTMRSLPAGFSKSAAGSELIEVIQSAMADTPAVYQNVDKRKPLSPSQRTLAELMRLLLEVVCADLGVAPKIIAGSEDLADIITDTAGAKALNGWRYEVFGRYVEQLRAGQIFFSYDPQKRRVKISGWDKSA